MTTTNTVKILRDLTTRHGSLIARAGEIATAKRSPAVYANDGSVLFQAGVEVTSSKGVRIGTDESAVAWL
jgi:hypothetical protein